MIRCNRKVLGCWEGVLLSSNEHTVTPWPACRICLFVIFSKVPVTALLHHALLHGILAGVEMRDGMVLPSINHYLGGFRALLEAHVLEDALVYCAQEWGKWSQDFDS